jgi:phytol kinase
VGGDAGFADLVGRKYGTSKLPYNSSKSYVGSLAFFVFASLASMGYVASQHRSFLLHASLC